MGVKADGLRWCGNGWAIRPFMWNRFAGSLAVGLARPGGAGPREIVCDTDGGLCNLWRALAWGDVERVAWWADYPTIHQDLTARHRWLRRWVDVNADRLSDDPTFFDEQAAGWWAWGVSLWIGGGWCATTHGQRPSTHMIVVAERVCPHKPFTTTYQISSYFRVAVQRICVNAPLRPFTTNTRVGPQIHARPTIVVVQDPGGLACPLRRSPDRTSSNGSVICKPDSNR